MLQLCTWLLPVLSINRYANVWKRKKTELRVKVYTRTLVENRKLYASYPGNKAFLQVSIANTGSCWNCILWNKHQRMKSTIFTVESGERWLWLGVHLSLVPAVRGTMPPGAPRTGPTPTPGLWHMSSTETLLYKDWNKMLRWKLATFSTKTA